MTLKYKKIQKHTKREREPQQQKKKKRLLTSTYVILIYNIIIAYNLHLFINLIIS